MSPAIYSRRSSQQYITYAEKCFSEYKYTKIQKYNSEYKHNYKIIFCVMFPRMKQSQKITKRPKQQFYQSLTWWTNEFAGVTYRSIGEGLYTGACSFITPAWVMTHENITPGASQMIYRQLCRLESFQHPAGYNLGGGRRVVNFVKFQELSETCSYIFPRPCKFYLLYVS